MQVDLSERTALVNVLSAVRFTRLTLPSMMERGFGRVLSIGSDSAVVTPAEMTHYGMSKTALLAVTRGFARAATSTGVSRSRHGSAIAWERA